jgi:hypothetical protein
VTAALDSKRSDGTVLGAPRRWLRLEGATLLVGALLAFSTTRQASWLVPLTVQAPDFLAVGYRSGTALGHVSTIWPTAPQYRPSWLSGGSDGQRPVKI